MAAGLSGLVLVGLNPVRRGAALDRDVAHADCQLVLSDTVDSVEVTVPLIDVASELDHRALGISWCSNPHSRTRHPTIFHAHFTSGTSGEPKAVRCTHEKVAVPGVMIAERFGLGPSDTCYLSMPMFHSNAIMAGWAPAVAAGRRLPLRRKFPLHSSFQTSGGSKPPTPTTWASRCPIHPGHSRARRRRRQSLRYFYGNEGAPRYSRFAERFDVVVIDGFRVVGGRHRHRQNTRYARGSLGPITDDLDIVDVDSGLSCPPGMVGELINRSGAGFFRGYYNDPRSAGRTDGRRRISQWGPRLP